MGAFSSFMGVTATWSPGNAMTMPHPDLSASKYLEIFEPPFISAPTVAPRNARAARSLVRPTTEVASTF